MDTQALSSLAVLVEEAGANRPLLLQLPRSLVFLLERSLRCVFAEGEALATGGLTPSDFEGCLFSDIVETNEVEELEATLLEALSGRDASARVRSRITGRRYALRVSPVVGIDGVEGLVVMGMDVTEQEEARDRLALSESRLAAFVDGMNAVAFVKDPEAGTSSSIPPGRESGASRGIEGSAPPTPISRRRRQPRGSSRPTGRRSARAGSSSRRRSSRTRLVAGSTSSRRSSRSSRGTPRSSAASRSTSPRFVAVSAPPRRRRSAMAPSWRRSTTPSCCSTATAGW